MHHSTPGKAPRRTRRAQSPLLNPYTLDDIALTLADIRAARAPSEPPVVR